MKTSKKIIEDLCDEFLKVSGRVPGEPDNASFEDWFWEEVELWESGNVNLISDLFEVFTALKKEESKHFYDWLYSEAAQHERGIN